MSLPELLEQVIAIKGIESSAVVSSSGELLEGASRDGEDVKLIGELITSGLASSRVLAQLLGDGEVSQTMIEYENGPVLIMPLGDEDDPVMVARLSSTSDLGRARFQLRKYVGDIAATVSA